MESDSGRMPNVVVYLYLLNARSRKGGLQKKGMGERGSFRICPCDEATSGHTLATGNVMFCCLLERGGLRKEKRMQVSGRLLAATALSACTPHPGDRWLLGLSGWRSSGAKPRIQSGCSATLLSAPGHLGPAAALHPQPPRAHPAFVVIYFFISTTGPWLSSASAFQG